MLHVDSDSKTHSDRVSLKCNPAAQEIIRQQRLYNKPLLELMEAVRASVEVEEQFAAMIASVSQGGHEQQQRQMGGPVPMELGAAQLRGQQHGQQRVRFSSPGRHQGAGRPGSPRYQGGSGSGCFNCDGSGHVRAQCTSRPGQVWAGQQCRNCQGYGHFAARCPTARPPQQQQHGGGGGGRFGVLRNHKPRAN